MLGVALILLIVCPHEVEPWFHSWYRGRLETIDSKYDLGNFLLLPKQAGGMVILVMQYGNHLAQNLVILLLMSGMLYILFYDKITS